MPNTRIRRRNNGHDRKQQHSHRPTLRSFEDDLFDIQNPETTQNRINSILNHLKSLVNNATTDNIVQSTKYKIQALVNRLNGNDISKALGKITQVLEKLTIQQKNTSNEPTPYK